MLDVTHAHDLGNEKLCEQCGNQFLPRSGTGGKPQKFCSNDCRQAFHSDAHRGQRSPTCSALPAVIDAEPTKVIKPTAEPPEAKFDWVNDASIVLNYQPAVAIYISRGGNLVIRQERAWDEEADTIICIAPESINTFIDKITDVVGIPSFP